MDNVKLRRYDKLCKASAFTAVALAFQPVEGQYTLTTQGNRTSITGDYHTTVSSQYNKLIGWIRYYTFKFVIQEGRYTGLASNMGVKFLESSH